MGLLEVTPTYIAAVQNPDEMFAAHEMESFYTRPVQRQITQHQVLIYINVMGSDISLYKCKK
jgi:hypothetical protein